MFYQGRRQWYAFKRRTIGLWGLSLLLVFLFRPCWSVLLYFLVKFVFLVRFDIQAAQAEYTQAILSSDSSALAIIRDSQYPAFLLLYQSNSILATMAERVETAEGIKSRAMQEFCCWTNIFPYLSKRNRRLLYRFLTYCPDEVFFTSLPQQMHSQGKKKTH